MAGEVQAGVRVGGLAGVEGHRDQVPVGWRWCARRAAQHHRVAGAGRGGQAGCHGGRAHQVGDRAVADDGHAELVAQGLLGGPRPGHGGDGQSGGGHPRPGAPVAEGGEVRAERVGVVAAQAGVVPPHRGGPAGAARQVGVWLAGPLQETGGTGWAERRRWRGLLGAFGRHALLVVGGAQGGGQEGAVGEAVEPVVHLLQAVPGLDQCGAVGRAQLGDQRVLRQQHPGSVGDPGGQQPGPTRVEPGEVDRAQWFAEQGELAVGAAEQLALGDVPVGQAEAGVAQQVVGDQGRCHVQEVVGLGWHAAGLLGPGPHELLGAGCHREQAGFVDAGLEQFGLGGAQAVVRQWPQHPGQQHQRAVGQSGEHVGGDGAEHVDRGVEVEHRPAGDQQPLQQSWAQHRAELAGRAGGGELAEFLLGQADVVGGEHAAFGVAGFGVDDEGDEARVGVVGQERRLQHAHGGQLGAGGDGADRGHHGQRHRGGGPAGVDQDLLAGVRLAGRLVICHGCRT